MITSIEFFTAGCPRSQISGKNLKKALQQLGVAIDFEPIDDPKLHAEKGVSAFPAVKVNGDLKSQGEFLSVDACKEMLSEYLK
jgi:hypothetical protein